MALPDGISSVEVHSLILSLFYPDRVPEQLREEFERSDKVKLAVVLEGPDKLYRVLRRADASSLRLQVRKSGRFSGLAKGPRQTTELLADEIGLPDYETFIGLNLWRFDDDGLYDSGAGGLDERERELVDKYRSAVRIERLEDRIKNLESEIDSKKSALGKGARVEEKLEQARAKLDDLSLADLSEDDLELLSNKDERYEEFDHQLDRLLRQEEDERIDVEGKLPDRPWKVPVFWAGLCVGIGALITSIAMHDSLRPVASVNVVAFGLVAWVLLKYFTDLERASVHQVRLESIKRRLNQVREEQVAFGEKINHLLIHAGVDDEHELFERVEKTNKLEDIISQLEDKAIEIRRDPEHKAARAEIKELRDELAEVTAERDGLPEYVMSSFQLESDLKSLGIDPKEALADNSAEAEPIPESAFGRLKLAAERNGEWTSDGLVSSTRKMWGKICGHVLSDRFADVELDADGELRVRDMNDEQLAMWRRTRSSEERIVASALALAIHVNARRRRDDLFETIWVVDPREEFGSKYADAFDDVFGSAAKKSHIVLCNV
jgi:hypothetical protein